MKGLLDGTRVTQVSLLKPQDAGCLMPFLALPVGRVGQGQILCPSLPSQRGRQTRHGRWPTPDSGAFSCLFVWLKLARLAPCVLNMFFEFTTTTTPPLGRECAMGFVSLARRRSRRNHEEIGPKMWRIHVVIS